jgi:hypothetical protein
MHTELERLIADAKEPDCAEAGRRMFALMVEAGGPDKQTPYRPRRDTSGEGDHR